MIVIGYKKVSSKPSFVQDSCRKCRKNMELEKYAPQESNEPRKSREKRSSAIQAAQKAAQLPPELVAVIDSWERLPGAVKADISAMVRAASG